MRPNKYSISYFMCTECGKKFPLPRPQSQRREKGHVKDLWCPFCKKMVKTIEIRDNDFYFMLDNSNYQTLKK